MGAYTAEERAIYRRILDHRFCWRLMGHVPHDTHRFYLAHSEKGGAVLRRKDEGGLREWRSRTWTEGRLFPDPPPTITDVTVQALEAIESVLGLSADEFQFATPWVSVEEGCRFFITPCGAGRPTATARPLWNFEGRPIYQALCPDTPPVQRVAPSMGAPFAGVSGSIYYARDRAFVWRHAPPYPVPPAAGGYVDGVSNMVGLGGVHASRGHPVHIEAGGVFEEGGILECDAEGRAIAQATGVGILRALEAGISGRTVWAVFV